MTERRIADVAPADDCRDADGVCRDTRHEHFDFDAYFGDWLAEAADRYWSSR
jgi:hypothetical protein